MKHLLPICLLTLLFACTEKETIYLAEATDSFIEGNYQGAHFHFSSQNYYEGRTEYLASEKEDDPVLASLPDQTGLFAGRIDAQSKNVAQLRIKDSRLHQRTFPTLVANATITFAQFDQGTIMGCPHIDPATEDEIPVDVEVMSWDQSIIVGTYRAKEGYSQDIAGTFSFPIDRPQ